MRIDFRFEPATEADKEYFRALNRSCYEELVVRQLGPWNDEEQNQNFEIKWPTNHFQKIFANDELVGGIWFDEHDEFRQLREIQIHPEFQGKGIGTALLKMELEQARCPIRLRVLFKNQAYHMYLRLGFVTIDQNDTQYIMQWQPDG